MDQQVVYLVSSLAGIFPPMTKGEYARLEESIREVGLLEEITLWRGTVIDGFHRLRACLRLGIEPKFSSLPDDADPLAHVIGKNDSRRALAPWQRPVAAFRASESSRVGRPRSAGENCANLRNFLTQDEAAGLFRVSRRSVSAAARVLGRESPAIPELRRAVLSERITVSDAAAAVREPATGCETTGGGSTASRRWATPTSPGCSTSSTTGLLGASPGLCWPTAPCRPTTLAKVRYARTS